MHLGEAQVDSSYFDGIIIRSGHKKILWLCAVCYMFDQMDVSSFSYVAPVLIQNHGITMSQVAQVNSLNFIGMFLGAILGGWLSDKIGRKRALILSIAIFSLASLLNSISAHYYILALGRLFTGAGVIMMSVIAMVYLSEMMPSEHRGRYVSLTIACGTIGVPLGAAFARWVVPLSAESWRYVFLLGGASILFLPLCFSWFKESPRWLVSKGRNTEAEKVIKEITGQVVDFSLKVTEKTKKSSTLETVKVMFSKEYLKRTITLLLITNGIVVGVHFLSGFYPAMMQETAGFELTLILTIMTISWMGVPLGDLSASFVSDRGGRKIPLAVYAIISGVAYLLCGFYAIPVVIIGAMFAIRFFGGGSASMLYTYLAESYPTYVRNNAVGLLMGSSRIIAATAVLSVPWILENYGWLGVHLVNAAIIIIPAVVVLIFGEKTGKRTLEEINSSQMKCLGGGKFMVG